jgi:sulfite oxidase
VPGYIGARNVKWLSRIDLQYTPSDNRFQAKECRLFPAHVMEEPAESSEGLMLGEPSVNAVTCSPSKGETLPAPSLSRGTP